MSINEAIKEAIKEIIRTGGDLLSKAHNKGYTAGRRLLFNDLRIIRELTEGNDPYQALELINDNYVDEDRDLLIGIFHLEEAAEESK